MLSSIIGVFDFPSFLVVAALCAVPTLPMIVWLIRTPTELEKARLQLDRDTVMAKIESERQLNIKKLDQNLITSHTRTED